MTLKKQLKEKNCIGCGVSFHKIDDKKHEYNGICVDEVVEIDKDERYAHRIQKIIWCQERHSKKEDWSNYKKEKLNFTIRFCYYVITSKNKKTHQRYIGFGQSSLNCCPGLAVNLFKKAKQKRFFNKMSKEQMKKELVKHNIHI